MLAAETHKLFGYWNALIKSSAVNRPWEWIQVWLNDNLEGDDFFRRYRLLIEKCKNILGEKKMELTSSHLPSSTTNW